MRRGLFHVERTARLVAFLLYAYLVFSRSRSFQYRAGVQVVDSSADIALLLIIHSVCFVLWIRYLDGVFLVVPVSVRQETNSVNAVSGTVRVHKVALDYLVNAQHLSYFLGGTIEDRASA